MRCEARLVSGGSGSGSGTRARKTGSSVVCIWRPARPSLGTWAVRWTYLLPLQKQKVRARGGEGAWEGLNSIVSRRLASNRTVQRPRSLAAEPCPSALLCSALFCRGARARHPCHGRCYCGRTAACAICDARPGLSLVWSGRCLFSGRLLLVGMAVSRRGVAALAPAAPLNMHKPFRQGPKPSLVELDCGCCCR